MKQVDYLIVGQGLAGTFFAHELEKNGHEFIVIDPDSHNASKTAAGMYNPVVLKRFSPVWQGQSQIEKVKQTMAELEKKFDLTLDYPMDILRVFHDNTERQTWKNKANSVELQGLLDRFFVKNTNKKILAPYGFGKVFFGGKVDINSLLSTFREHLSKQKHLVNEKVDYTRMTVKDAGWLYRGEKVEILAKKVVCCEGYGLKHNPFFNNLPLKGDKGEVLIIKAPNINLKALIKSKVFIMPMPELGRDIYFVGSTYHWTDKDDIPTVFAQKELLDKLSLFVDDEITVLSHRAGMRPTVIDRRPLLGKHQTLNHLYVLNGLGTRGVMLGASMAKYLYDFIEKEHALPEEVSITRFDNKLV